MQTDMDLDFNYLYWDNGDCWDFTISISPDEDYEVLASDLLKEAEEMSKYKYDDDGRILGHKNYLELLDAINEDLGSWSDKEDFEIMCTKIEDADLDDEERIELKDKLQEAFDTWGQEQEQFNYDKRAVEKEYGLEDGELDGTSIRDAEDLIGCEEGELDRFIVES